MPLYGYRCPSCGTEFEVVQRMTDDAVANCPKCGAAGRRQFFPTGIVFKGSGFYATNSRRGSAGVAPGSGGKKPAPGSDGEKPAAAKGGDTTPSTGASGPSAGAAAPGSEGTSAGTTAA